MTGWSYAKIDVTVWLTIVAWKKWTWCSCGFGVGALNNHRNEKTDDDEQFHFRMFQSR
jgi:hypothetical protein